MYLILIEPLEGGLGVVETMASDFFLIYWQSKCDEFAFILKLAPTLLKRRQSCLNLKLN